MYEIQYCAPTHVRKKLCIKGSLNHNSAAPLKKLKLCPVSRRVCSCRPDVLLFADSGKKIYVFWRVWEVYIFCSLLLEVSLEALAVVEFLKRYELGVDVEGGLGALLAANDPNAGSKKIRIIIDIFGLFFYFSPVLIVLRRLREDLLARLVALHLGSPKNVIFFERTEAKKVILPRPVCKVLPLLRHRVQEELSPLVAVPLDDLLNKKKNKNKSQPFLFAFKRKTAPP